LRRLGGTARRSTVADGPARVVSDSMLGMELASVARWSDRVTVALGQNPGPFTGPGTNTYVVGTGASRVLLDTGQGLEEYLPVLERAVGESGADRLEQIVLTHAHPDHLGGVDSVLARFGPMPVSKMPWPELDGALRLQELADGDEVAVEGATLRALWTPGHARDHLCFYMIEEKAVFTGDVVLGAGTTVIPRDGDLSDYLASLRRLLDLDMEVIYPAHGPAIHEPHAKVREYLAHRALREQQILAGLRSGIRTIERLVAGIYVDVPAFLHPAAGVSVEAHLRKLRQEGVVETDGAEWWLR